MSSNSVSLFRTFSLNDHRQCFAASKIHRKRFQGKPTRPVTSRTLSDPFKNLSSTTICKPIRTYLVQVSPEVEVEGFTSDVAKMDKVVGFTDALWQFLRPHTIIGTTLASLCIAGRTWMENSHLIRWQQLPLKAMIAYIALLYANGYIVGINQIYDVGIDKINKSYLPMASGDISLRSAWRLVLVLAVAGIVLVVLNESGPFLTSLYALALLLGTIYSVPPFRMKRFPVAAFLIIAAVRGFILNFGIYYASRAVLGLPFEWSLPVVFITTFVTMFALVIAITKDLPDVEGDRKFQIPTLARKLGERNIAFVGTGLLLLNYIAAACAAIYMPQAFNGKILIPTHAIMALTLIFQARVLDQANYTKEAITKFYRFLWKLLYAEFIVFPLI